MKPACYDPTPSVIKISSLPELYPSLQIIDTRAQQQPATVLSAFPVATVPSTNSTMNVPSDTSLCERTIAPGAPAAPSPIVLDKKFKRDKVLKFHISLTEWVASKKGAKMTRNKVEGFTWQPSPKKGDPLFPK